jgi:hypothetical protein
MQHNVVFDLVLTETLLVFNVRVPWPKFTVTVLAFLTILNSTSLDLRSTHV